MQAIEFEGFILDNERRELRAPDGRNIVLKSKAFDTLSVLAAEPGKIISKQHLMDRVWPDVTVEENNLNQTISMLRRALDDSRDTPRFIQTVPRQGYLFMPQVRQIDRPAAVGAEHAPGASPTPRQTSSGHQPASLFSRLTGSRARLGGVFAGLAAIAVLMVVLMTGLISPSAIAGSRDASIAVLPFENLGPDDERDYFARGVTVEIMDLLSQLDDLEVIDRNSSFSFGPEADVRDLGQALGVRYVLSGSVRTGKDRVRISARLSSAETGKQQWARTYERALSPEDLFAVQRLIAQQVAGALSIAFNINPGERIDGAGTRSLEAYDWYLRGADQWFYGSTDYPAEDLFQRAIDIDPQYAEAWAGMAVAIINSTWAAGSTEQGLARLQAGSEMARRAIELNPDLANAHATLGVARLMELDWIGARESIDAAVAKSRNQLSLAHQESLVLRSGHLSDALTIAHAIRDTNPLTEPLSVREDVIRSALGQHDLARAEIDKQLDQAPGQYTLVLPSMFAQINANAPSGEILSSLRNIAENAPAGPSSLARDLLDAPDDNTRRSILRAAVDDLGDEYATRTELLAHLAAWLGDTELALEIWDRDLRRSPLRAVWIWGPAFADMRATPGFRQLMHDINLVAYWKAYGWPDKCRPTTNDDFVCR